MKNFIVFLLGVVCPLVSVASITPTQQNYINELSKLAISEMNETGIPASITIAQAILEASWGNGELAKNANNYFGVKCQGDCTHDVYFKVDDDIDAKTGEKIKSAFRKYSSIEESFKDHSRFLRENVRYAKLFKYNQTDYINWAIGLQDAGYATNDSYALLLIDLIEKHNLHRFDIVKKPSPIVNVNRHEITNMPKAIILASDYVPLCMKASKGVKVNQVTHTNIHIENYHNGFIRKNIRIIRHKPHLASKARK